MKVRTVPFSLGVALGTPGVLAVVPRDILYEALNRHARGDWGDLSPKDAAANDAALRRGERLLSSYTTPAGVKFWVLTEADRSATTALLPSEY